MLKPAVSKEELMVCIFQIINSFFYFCQNILLQILAKFIIIDYFLICLFDYLIIIMYLNCHSYYSLRYGTISIEELVAGAKRNSIESLTLTDINNIMGTIDFVKECRINGIKPIAGIEFRNKQHQLLYTAVASNNKGFSEINRFLTQHNLTETELPSIPPMFDNAYTIFPYQAGTLLKLKQNEYIGVQPHELRKLATSKFRYRQDRLVAFHPVTFAKDTDYILHRHLRAIGNNTLLSKLTPEQLASPKEKLLPPDFIEIMYEDYPELARNTKQLIKDCEIDFDFSTVKKQTDLYRQPL